jgi:hypothetical protein
MVRLADRYAVCFSVAASLIQAATEARYRIVLVVA